VHLDIEIEVPFRSFRCTVLYQLEGTTKKPNRSQVQSGRVISMLAPASVDDGGLYMTERLTAGPAGPYTVNKPVRKTPELQINCVLEG
jgi:hypothetical protein